MTFTTLWQSATQLAAEHPVISGMAVGSGVGSVLLLGLKAFVNRVVNAFDGLGGQVTAFQTILAAHEREDVRRFGEIEQNASRRHEDLRTMIQTHADAVAVPLAAVQLDQDRLNVRVTALESEPRRKR